MNAKKIPYAELTPRTKYHGPDAVESRDLAMGRLRRAKKAELEASGESIRAWFGVRDAGAAGEAEAVAAASAQDARTIRARDRLQSAQSEYDAAADVVRLRLCPCDVARAADEATDDETRQ